MAKEFGEGCGIRVRPTFLPWRGLLYEVGHLCVTEDKEVHLAILFSKVDPVHTLFFCYMASGNL